MWRNRTFLPCTIRRLGMRGLALVLLGIPGPSGAARSWLAAVIVVIPLPLVVARRRGVTRKRMLWNTTFVLWVPIPAIMGRTSTMLGRGGSIVKAAFRKTTGFLVVPAGGMRV